MLGDETWVAYYNGLALPQFDYEVTEEYCNIYRDPLVKSWF